MDHLPDTVAKQQTSYNTAASGGDSIVTLSAPGATSYNVIDWISFSYAAAPTTGLLTVTDTTNNSILLKAHVTAGGIDMISFGERGLVCAKNAAIQVKLDDGSQGKHLTVGYR